MGRHRGCSFGRTSRATAPISARGFQSAKELVDNQTWDMILGNAKLRPRFSQRSSHDRLTDAACGSSRSRERRQSRRKARDTNGYRSEGQPPDLQYACTLNLPETRDCSATTDDCDCARSDVTKNPCAKTPPPVLTTQIQHEPRDTRGFASSRC